MKKYRTIRFTLAALLLFVCSTVFPGGNQEISDTGSPLHLSKIVLFSTGIGYFKRNGIIDGNGSIDLFFHIKDVNDLLKSMILLDFDGGTINSVNYASREPVAQALR